MQDHVLARYPFGGLSGQVKADSRRDLEPRLARSHTGRHIGRSNAGRKRAQRAVGAGVRIGAYDRLARSDKPLLGQKRVLHTHLAHVVEVCNVLIVRELAAHLTVLRRLYILIRREVVEHYRHLVFVENLIETRGLKFLYRDRSRNVVAENHIELSAYKLSGFNAVQTRVRGKYLLSHCHAHCQIPPNVGIRD